MACVFAGVVALSGCGRKPEPDILFITVDTLRPDALGVVSPGRDTPNIDALATSGRTFTHAVSPVPLTLPSHTSMLSGLLPAHHGVRDNGQSVPGDIPLLQQVLRDKGYRTAAFVSGFPLQRMFGLDRGFDHYDDVMSDGEQGWVERRAADTVAAVLGWFDGAGAGEGPRFTWVHFYDPHDPYEPPREFWQPGPRGAYDGEVSYTDHWIGRLVERARTAAGSRPLVVVVTADHGEALGEHDEITHGYFVYDSTMRVPLVFDWPGRIVPAIGDEPVQLVDITPTLLDLLGFEALPRTDGRSLVKALEGGEVDLHPAVVETWLPWTYYGWAPLAGVSDGGWKFIDAPEGELYDLRTDPHEADNKAVAEPAMADRLALRLEAIVSEGGRVASTDVDDAAIQRLRSLGYVGVGAPVVAPPKDLPDPKKRVAMRNQLQAAEVRLRAGDYAGAQILFEQVLATDADNRFALLRSGIALLRLGRAGEAVPVLSRAVAAEPRRAEARFALGDALMREKEFHAAAEQWAALAELQPRRAEAWYNLAVALEHAGETERARDAREAYDKLAREAAASPGAAGGTP